MDFKETKETYQKIWKFKEYQLFSPELLYVDDILKWINKKPIYKILSLGCGQGYGIYKFLKEGYDVEGIDVDNFSHITEIKKRVIIGNICDINNYKNNYDLIYSIDVLEHLTEEDIDKVFNIVAVKSTFFYFVISCQPDNLGKLINKELHLTVKPGYWWIEKINEYFNIESYWGDKNKILIKGSVL